jgi:uncharacterized protein YacL
MIWALRIFFALILTLIGREVVNQWWTEYLPADADPPWWWGSLAGLLIAGIFIAVEVAFTRRFIALVSVVLFGVVFGFIASFLFVHTLELLPVFAQFKELRDQVQYASMAVFVYLAVIGILTSRDDFKFVIPFIDIQREKKAEKPLILDTSVIIDGRIADLVDLRVVSAKIILPRFVLVELQTLADSADKLKRARGRRGLDVMNRVQKTKAGVVEIYDGMVPGVEGVDAKLVALAKHIDGRLVTNDFNLNKVAQIQGIEVVNLNDVATAMRPVLLPGEELEVQIQHPGDQQGQGVGYLEDGTKIVVEHGYAYLGKPVLIKVTNVIQTSMGRMVFGAIKGMSQMPMVADAAGRGSRPPAPKPGGPISPPPAAPARNAGSPGVESHPGTAGKNAEGVGG